MYQTTIRISRAEDKKLLDQVKHDFWRTSLSRAIVLLAHEYYRLKERDEAIRKSIETKYEIPSEVLEKLYK